MSRRAALLLLLLLLVALAPPAAAQQHPNVARGFSSTGSYNPGDVDSVNAFNGNLVLGIPLGGSYPAGGGLSHGLTLVYNSNVWDYQYSDNGTTTLAQALPNRTANAGLGWMVSLGRLNPPTSTDVDTNRTVYMSPDGALHSFYPTLHEGETAVAGVQYTRDGTYLRFRAAANEIDFPDGTVHRFNAQGYPVQIRGRFTNQVGIDYSTGDWVITDGFRTERVTFRTLPGVADPVVGSVQLSAFGGFPATYQFRYNTDDNAPYQVSGCRNTDPATANRSVPVLTRLILPDGSSYGMAVADYGTRTAAPCDAGMLHGLTLPTLGRIEWDYIEYAYPTSSSPHAFRQKTSGVGERRLRDASGNLLGRWTYSTALTPDPASFQPRELVNTRVTPLGDKTVSYFSVAASDDPVKGWTPYEYGLPLTRNVTDGGSTTRYLSSQVYDCDPGPVNCQLKRTGYLAYEWDAGPPAAFEDAGRRNQRAFTTRTDDNDAGLLSAMVYAAFDGLGHYRQTDTYGNFGAGDRRRTYVSYDHNVVPAATEPWILGTFTDATVTDPATGESAKVELCFDPATGFLQRSRTLAAGTARSGNDVVVRYTPDARGDVAREESFGGDGAGLDTVASLCGLALGTAQYRTDHTYQYGVRATSQDLGVPYRSLDQDVDAASGLPLRSRDVSGQLVTTYDYDLLGRPTWIRPAQDAWTHIVYTAAASPSSPAQAYMARQTAGGTVLAEARTLLDSLGRVGQEQRRMADGTWSTRTVTYNALGWKTSVSELGSVNATTFLGYDPFGRPATVRPPEGNVHDVSLSYAGRKTVTRTVKVATSYDPATGAAAETNAVTVETYDGQGRLAQVTEPNGTVTRYEYDVGSRLKRVCQGASGPSCGQERLFTYDTRGFLTSEKHPEKGPAGNGTVSYLLYDSRGNAHRVIDGASDLTYVFDAAERVVQVSETNGRPLKVFSYGPNNLAGNPRLGKLVQAQRFNYHSVGGAGFKVLLTESYTYGGREGRVSRLDTAVSVNDGVNESFTQGFAYDDLGNAQTVDYPQCTFAACASTPRSVTSAYANGWLTSVPGYTGTAPGQAAGVGITYHPNGMVKEVAHGNGVVDAQAPDSYGRPRPSSITASLGATSLWTTGAYQYDGAGNVWKIGPSWYEYDALSRVRTGAVVPGPLGTGTQQKQAYAFDAYGNLQSITTQIGAGAATVRNTPTSAATNRLTGAAGYDAAGNLISWNGAVYEYDAFDRMRRMTSGTEDWIYSYDADDERIWAYDLRRNVSRWTLRGLDGRVLRDLTNDNGTWSVAEDYIYRDGLLLAGYLGNGQRRHFHLDHLGTPRLLTNAAGLQAGYHVYYPFGEEATPFDPAADRLQFTGHERDLNAQTGTNPSADDLDFMHARFFNPQVGRFLGVDALEGSSSVPQSWNRYSYVMGNPIGFVDPTGMAAVEVCNSSGTNVACGGSMNVPMTDSADPNPGPDLSGFNNFLLSAYFFAGGAFNAASTNFTLGVGRYNYNAPAYQLGQSFGDLASIYLGLREFQFGVSGEALGLLADVGGGAGALANVSAGAIMLHGVAQGALGAVNFMKGMKGSSSAKKTPKARVSGKEGAKDIPSWAEGERPYVGENGKDFARRLCDKKFGPGGYDTGPASDFNKLKKFADRAFE